jgi:glycosyltransferase 2 family protein
VIHTLARSTWVRVLLTAAILLYMSTRLDMGEALRALVAVRVSHLAIVALLVACDRMVMIWRWIVLLRSSGSPVTTRVAARIFLVSSFVGSFLPAGVGADAARAYALSRHTARGGEAIASVTIDRYLGIVALALLGAAGAFTSTRLLPSDQRGWLVAAALLLTIASVGLFWLDRIIDRVLPAAWHDGAIGRRLRAATRSIGEYRGRPGTLFAVLILSFVVQWLRIIQAYGLGLGLGIDVPFSYYIVFMPVGLLLLLMPVSISGFGLPQGVIVWMLRPVGVPDAQGFALSTLIVLAGLAGNLPGAWLYLRGRRHPSPPAREAATIADTAAAGDRGISGAAPGASPSAAPPARR